jgi:hypothetical protein
MKQNIVFQGNTVYDMRYLATIVGNCFQAFGEVLQMNTRLAELSAGVTRVSQLLASVESCEGLQREISSAAISGDCISGAIIDGLVNVITYDMIKAGLYQNKE